MSRSENVTWHRGEVTPEQRARVTGGPGTTVWLTGLSASGKSTIAAALERALVERGRAAYLLDGDNLRHGLNGDLGFTAADRSENIRRIGQVARLFADAGVVALVPVISPYGADRAKARAAHDEAGVRFVEVWVSTPIEECERRDPKGLYAKARAGEITGFTGIDDPYEPPSSPDVTIDASVTALERAVEQVLEVLGAPEAGRR